jgi:hypothetical protein
MINPLKKIKQLKIIRAILKLRSILRVIGVKNQIILGQPTAKKPRPNFGLTTKKN